MAPKDSLELLTSLLADITSVKDMKAFVSTFFSESEQTVFAKRLTILMLLDEGKSYEEISKELKVSSATISSIATIKDHQITTQALKLMKRDQRLNQLFRL